MQVAVEKGSGRIRKQWSKPTTVAEFEKWEAKQKGDWNYEFYYGEVIKKGGMKQSEAILVAFLMKCFMITGASKEDGSLMPEVEMYIDEQRKRIPDLAYFSREQIVSMAKGNKKVPAFIIELLSKNESFEEIERKLQDYFDVGVQLVWYISPKSKQIYAYSAKNVVKIFATGDVAVAAPVLPDFKIEIEKLFTIA